MLTESTGGGDTSDPRDQSYGKSPAETWKQELLLRDWQIQFGYASHFRRPLPKLGDIARNLVQLGIADSAYVADNGAWWASDDTSIESPAFSGKRRASGHGPIEIDVSADRRKANVKFPKLPPGYVLEGLVQAANLRYQELFLLGGDQLPPRYLRAQLGKFSFVDDESALQVYPQLKIFENGVVLLYFRMLSPGDPQSLRRFLRRFVNAPLTGFRRVLVPPAIAYWSALATADPTSFEWFRRPWTAWAQRKYGMVIAGTVAIDDDLHFAFPLVSIATGIEQTVIETVKESLTELSPQILEQAREKVGLGPDAFKTEKAFRQAIELSRLEGEESEATIERLQREIESEVGSRATEAGELLSKSAIEFLRDREETFAGIALTVMAVAGYVGASRASGPRNLISLALAGPGKLNVVGQHWGGHHHVHLIRFRQQGPTASENERLHGADFGRIIARTILPDADVARSMLPPSSRLFDDVGCYVAINGTLWVQSRSSLDMHHNPDPNKGHLVHEHQVKAELLDYAYALHRRIAERGTSRAGSLEDVYDAQQDLADVELALHDSSHFGEIRELVGRGLEAYGISAFRDRMATAIRVREAIAGHNRARRVGRFTLMLSLVAGALAIPPLATEVVAPLWQWRGWHAPSAESPRKLMYVGVATLFIAFVLLVGGVWAGRLPSWDKSFD